MSLFVFNATGGASAVMAYAQDVTLTFDQTYQKFLFMTTGVDFMSRSQDVLVDQNVKMEIGRLYAGVDLFQLMDSAVNISAMPVLVSNADQVTGTFSLYSARIEHYQFRGREKELFSDSITIRAPDISGV